jgi:hypothetical protein
MKAVHVTASEKQASFRRRTGSSEHVDDATAKQCGLGLAIGIGAGRVAGSVMRGYQGLRHKAAERNSIDR